jgi:SAM-dependent methyltransferase
MIQDKQKEIAFFDNYAEVQQYNVFNEKTNTRIVQKCVELGGLQSGGLVADLGCGSGVFTNELHKLGFQAFGIDLSARLVELGRRTYPHLEFLAGDVEFLSLASESLDGVLLSGILHHLPDPQACAREVWRVLKPGGVFIAFDPNRLNPFMWLYRDRSSPFYSNKGVTENERPIVASRMAKIFREVGFEVKTGYLSDLQYRYIASGRVRWALPVYNFVDSQIFRLKPLKPYSAFVLTAGVKK